MSDLFTIEGRRERKARYIDEIVTVLTSYLSGPEPVTPERFSGVVAVLTGELGMTNRALASEFGVTVTTVARWAEGKNQPREYVRIKALEDCLRFVKEMQEIPSDPGVNPEQLAG